MSAQQHMDSELWPGVTLSIGAGLGAASGVLLAGGPGIAVGAAIGAGLGVVAGSLAQTWAKDRAQRK